MFRTTRKPWFWIGGVYLLNFLFGIAEADSLVLPFADDFENGDAESWSTIYFPPKIPGPATTLAIVPGAAQGGSTYGLRGYLVAEPGSQGYMYLQDDNPSGVSSYSAAMHLRFDDLVMAPGHSLPIFRGRTSTPSVVFELRLVQGATSEPRLLLARDSSAGPAGLSREVCLATTGFHLVEMRWRSPAGQNPGLLALYVDGLPRAAVASVELSAAALANVRLGPLRLFPDGADSGFYDMDNFSSSATLPAEADLLFSHDFECATTAGWSSTSP